MLPKKQPRSSNIRLVVFFVVFLAVLIICALALRLVVLMASSSFDGSHRFTIAVPVEPNKVDLLSFAPDEDSVSVLRVSSWKDSRSLQKIFGVSVDAYVDSAVTGGEITTKADLEDVMQTILLTKAGSLSGMTPFDVARLLYFTTFIPAHNIDIEQIPDFAQVIKKHDMARIDGASSQLFLEKTITDEKQSIQILNEADVSGLGGRLARLLTRSGANVVSVVTSEKPKRKTRILYSANSPSYTVIKIEKVLGIKASKNLQSQSISDIIVELGEDKAVHPGF